MAAGNLINTEYELPKDFKSMITKAKNDINVVNSYVVVIDHRQVNVVKWAISIDENSAINLMSKSVVNFLMEHFHCCETYLSCFSNIEVG